MKSALPQGVTPREFNGHINDAQFADAIVEQVLAVTGQRQAPSALR